MACACTTMGDVLPRVVWPGDVADYVAKLDPQMRATDATATACASLLRPTLTAWRDFFDSWTKFKKDASCFFGCANKFDQCAQFEKELASWQDLIGKSCSLSAPPVQPFGGDDSAVKWIAAAVIVTGIVYVAAPWLRSLAK